MVLSQPAPVATRPLVAGDRPRPEPGAGEVRVTVEVCGVCRTDLHVVEGDLAPQRDEVVPGHQIVGRVDALGPGVRGVAVGARVGVAWLHRTCGSCRFCGGGRENLCLDPTFTGWQVDGGYAEYACAPADFVYPIPEDAPAAELAPLLCAGVIGYRAYTRSRVRPGGHLGLWGFGGSAHIVIQIALYHGCEVSVFSREAVHREHAAALGAAWVGGSFDPPPRPLDAAIVFAPAGELVPAALAATDRGGTVAIAGIHLSDVPPLDYQRHLFQERALCSVTANTRDDGRALLRLAREIPIRTTVHPYPLEAANDALADLEAGRLQGAAVLTVSGSGYSST